MFSEFRILAQQLIVVLSANSVSLFSPHRVQWDPKDRDRWEEQVEQATSIAEICQKLLELEVWTVSTESC